MTRDQNLVGGATAYIVLSVCQISVCESGVDAYFVVTVLQRQHLIMGETKPPVFPVVRRSVRDPVRMLGKRMQVWLQFTQWHRGL